MDMKRVSHKNKCKNLPNKNKKTLLIIGLLFLIISFVLSFFMIQKYIVGRINVNRWNNLYQESITLNSANTNTNQDDDLISVGSDATTLANNDKISQDFSTLMKINDDVVGYVIIPDTMLSLPVVQGQDNAFYLDKTLEKKKNPFGIPFLDYRATISDVGVSNNLTIYGHAANDGSYFSAIKSYKKLDYYKKHPIIKYNSIYSQGDYKIIGVFMEDVSIDNKEAFAFHNYVNMNETEFNYYIDEVKKRSYFKTDVDVAFGDELVTLSTCDTDVNNSLTTPYRIALVARKVRTGETNNVDVLNATINNDMIMPKGWMDKFGRKNPYK